MSDKTGYTEPEIRCTYKQFEELVKRFPAVHAVTHVAITDKKPRRTHSGHWAWVFSSHLYQPIPYELDRYLVAHAQAGIAAFKDARVSPWGNEATYSFHGDAVAALSDMLRGWARAYHQWDTRRRGRRSDASDD